MKKRIVIFGLIFGLLQFVAVGIPNAQTKTEYSPEKLKTYLVNVLRANHGFFTYAGDVAGMSDKAIIELLQTALIPSFKLTDACVTECVLVECVNTKIMQACNANCGGCIPFTAPTSEMGPTI